MKIMQIFGKHVKVCKGGSFKLIQFIALAECTKCGGRRKEVVEAKDAQEYLDSFNNG